MLRLAESFVYHHQEVASLLPGDRPSEYCGIMAVNPISKGESRNRRHCFPGQYPTPEKYALVFQEKVCILGGR